MPVQGLRTLLFILATEPAEIEDFIRWGQPWAFTHANESTHTTYYFGFGDSRVGGLKRWGQMRSKLSPEVNNSLTLLYMLLPGFLPHTKACSQPLSHKRNIGLTELLQKSEEIWSPKNGPQFYHLTPKFFVLVTLILHDNILRVKKGKTIKN